MKSFIASSLAGLLLVLTPPQPAAAQDLAIDRLIESCRPQLEALDQETVIRLERNIGGARRAIADYGSDDQWRIDELRTWEAALADIRANGVNSPGTREWIGEFLQYDDALLREYAAGGVSGPDGYAAAHLCLVQARLAGVDQNTPPSQAQEGPPGLRDKSPASTGLAPATVGSDYGVQPSGGNGDVFGRCVQIARYPDDGGIQTVWAMNNVCSQSIIVSYCFRAAVEAAGDPNLCSRLEKRTNEIPGNGKIDFPFTLVDEGQSMSDGTLAGENNLTVLGFACTEGRFPNVYFDGGRFLSRGC